MEDITANQRKSIEGFISAYNAFDVDRMISFVHQDVEFKNVSGNEVTITTDGIHELRALAEQSKSLFSSRHQSITSYETEGDTVTVGINFEAVLAVDMSNGAKKGDTMNAIGRSVFQFKDGKIWRITDYS